MASLSQPCGRAKRLKVFDALRARYFPAAFFCSAQRRFTASAMRRRPSGERFLFFFTGTAADLGGLPGPRFTLTEEAPPASKARACCNWAISRSIWARISDTPTFIPPSGTRVAFPALCLTPFLELHTLRCAASGYAPAAVRKRAGTHWGRSFKRYIAPKKPGSYKMRKG